MATNLETRTFVDSGYRPRAVALRLLQQVTGRVAQLEGSRAAGMALYWLNRGLGCLLPPDGLGEARSGGLKIVLSLDHHDVRHTYLTGRYEPEVTRMAHAILRVGDVAIDVGANIGWHTLNFARLVGASGCVFAFEPAAARTLLERSISRNRFEGRVSVRAEALGDAVGCTELHLDRDAGLLNSLQPHGWLDQETVTVPLSTLDVTVLPRLDRQPRLLKIDVEGTEYEVLRGGAALLDSLPPEFIIVELSSMRDGQPLLDLLSECGYQAVELHNGRLHPIAVRPPRVSPGGPGTAGFHYLNVCLRHMSSRR